MSSNVENFKMTDILNDYFCNHVYGNYSINLGTTLNTIKVVLVPKNANM